MFKLQNPNFMTRLVKKKKKYIKVITDEYQEVGV